jgi:hypothetical protein
MSNPHPKLPSILRYACELGREPKLIRETKWSCEYKTGEKSFAIVSKFLTDEKLAISATGLRELWPGMDEYERLDFVHSFSAKKYNEKDYEILDMIMEDGDDRLCSSCALMFLRHPDRERVVRFLIERVQKCGPTNEPDNYIQVLGFSKDLRAVAAIRPYFEKYLKEMEAEKLSGIPDNVFFGPIPYSQYFCVCETLLKITGSAEYEEAIRKYLDHPNEQVRWWAEHALGVEGPTSSKRTAEFLKGKAKSEMNEENTS